MLVPLSHLKTAQVFVGHGCIEKFAIAIFQQPQRNAGLKQSIDSHAEGTLAVLGISVQPPTPSWGQIIADDRSRIATSPHILLEPALLIFFTVFALNFLGDVVRARFDVREGAL